MVGGRTARKMYDKSQHPAGGTSGAFLFSPDFLPLHGFVFTFASSSTNDARYFSLSTTIPRNIGSPRKHYYTSLTLGTETTRQARNLDDTLAAVVEATSATSSLDFEPRVVQLLLYLSDRDLSSRPYSKLIRVPLHRL